MNEKLVELFYSMYFRAPKRSEFIQCGGNVEKVEMLYGSYSHFLNVLGHKLPSERVETYDVINSYGVVIFTGTAVAIAEEFNTSPNNVITRVRKDGLLKKKYKLEVKPFTSAAAKIIKKEMSIVGTKRHEMYVKQLQTYILNKVNVSEKSALAVAKLLYKLKDDQVFNELLKGD